MNEEIKENNIPINILQALGNLTNGAINYYQLPKTTLEEQRIILNYITNLQEENKELNRVIELYSKSLYNADLTRYKEENQKLINVIDELEKWLKNDIKNIYRDAGYRNNIMSEVLDKLTELKKGE